MQICFRIKSNVQGGGGSHKNGERRITNHDVCSHACDSLRTFADAWAAGLIAKESGWRYEEDDEDDEDGRRSAYSGLARGAESLD